MRGVKRQGGQGDRVGTDGMGGREQGGGLRRRGGHGKLLGGLEIGGEGKEIGDLRLSSSHDGERSGEDRGGGGILARSEVVGGWGWMERMDGGG